MTADQAKKKINALIEEIEEHTELYYQEHRTEITDKQFDDLLKQLNNLEKEFPQFKSVNSPTQRVGGAITKDFPHVFHEYPMVSLGNAYSNQDLFDFDNRIFKNLGHRDFDYICEQKFDGASLSLVYKKNVLVSGVTRGDGFWGDDVTNNVKTIRNIPLRIKGENIPEEFHVRGEVFFSKSIFTKLNKELEDIGEEKYSNARNTASGTLRMQDSAEVSRRKLDCYVYNLLGENIGTQTHEGNLKKLKEWKFNVSPTYKKCIDIQEVIAYITYWEDERKNLEVETDGVVIKVNTLRHQRELGFTAKVPRWAIAYKYKSESALTVLNSITYQVGRTGAITPVAELEPVQLAGTIVKRASLHNANEIERLDLRIGDYVFVEKGGEIIPKVTGVDTTKRTQKTRRIIYLTYCPECKTPLVRTEGEASHYCPNINSCPPKLKEE